MCKIVMLPVPAVRSWTKHDKARRALKNNYFNFFLGNIFFVFLACILSVPSFLLFLSKKVIFNFHSQLLLDKRKELKYPKISKNEEIYQE